MHAQRVGQEEILGVGGPVVRTERGHSELAGPRHPPQLACERGAAVLGAHGSVFLPLWALALYLALVPALQARAQILLLAGIQDAMRIAPETVGDESEDPSGPPSPWPPCGGGGFSPCHEAGGASPRSGFCPWPDPTGAPSPCGYWAARARSASNSSPHVSCAGVPCCGSYRTMTRTAMMASAGVRTGGGRFPERMLPALAPDASGCAGCELPGVARDAVCPWCRCRVASSARDSTR